MSRWDYMDNKVWESSEVMKELESILKKQAGLAKDGDILKQADMAKKLQDVKTLGAEVAKVTETTKALNKTIENMGMSDDNPEDLKTERKRKKVKKKKISKKEYNLAKDELLEELNKMAAEAADKLDHKLSYKIERAIDSINFDE
jgi:uncharacterized protein YwgA